uniref:EF-hand domain-containing protein n=1 Tax=Takifugu rubripes TaxID=31033 RepID=A0A674P8P2_TAKRU
MEKKELSIFNAMKFLKDCFDEHAAKDGEKATMTKKELADLLFFFHFQTENHIIAQYFDGMDKDGDEKITFTEYMSYLTKLFEGF